MFYSNEHEHEHEHEHEPVHVHGKFQGRESRAEIILVDGAVEDLNYTNVAGRAPLEANEMRFFQEIVAAKADEIVSKWILISNNPQPSSPGELVSA